MAINPLSAALAAIQLGAGLSGIRSRMRDRSGQDRIQKLLQQAQARNLRGAQQIAASGEGINPALAQRAALGYLTEANQEAARSAMAQEAAMAERDRARTDRLTGGALGALGSFGAQLLAGQDTSEDEADSADTKSAMAAMSRQIAAKRAAQPTQTPSLNALEATLNEEAEAGAAISPVMTKPATPGAMPDEDKPPTAPTWGTAPAAAPAAPAEQTAPAAAAAPAAQTARPPRPRRRVTPPTPAAPNMSQMPAGQTVPVPPPMSMPRSTAAAMSSAAGRQAQEALEAASGTVGGRPAMSTQPPPRGFDTSLLLNGRTVYNPLTQRFEVIDPRRLGGRMPRMSILPTPNMTIGPR